MKKYVLLVAAGTGTRLSEHASSSTTEALPKQLRLIAGRPLVAHTLLRVQAALPDAEYLLVLPQTHLSTWQNYCNATPDLPHHRALAGGHSRFASVSAGLRAIKSQSEALVAVHDGVRPLLSEETLQESFRIAAEKGSAVAALPISSSLRAHTPLGSISKDRNNYCIVQTPQTFYLSWLRSAFTETEEIQFTDEATVLEHAGYPIHLFPGDRRNIKITYPEDIEWLSWQLQQESSTHPH